MGAGEGGERRGRVMGENVVATGRKEGGKSKGME